VWYSLAWRSGLPLLRMLEDVAMQKPVQIDADLYARAAAAAAREGKHVETYINELIRLQIREAERMHQLDRALDEIAIESDALGNAGGR
jgi:hypothetical protein